MGWDLGHRAWGLYGGFPQNWRGPCERVTLKLGHKLFASLDSGLRKQKAQRPQPHLLAGGDINPFASLAQRFVIMISRICEASSFSFIVFSWLNLSKFTFFKKEDIISLYILGTTVSPNKILQSGWGGGGV